MDDDRDFKARIDKTAKNYRLLKRADVFERNRKNVRQQLSYLKCMSGEQKSVILHSINGQLPTQLPPLSPYTISYYRRSSKPVFKTRVFEGGELNAHMCYQSLFILAGIQQMHFPNYQQVVKQFELQLSQYLSSPYPQVREMAMIAAGNKILGKQRQIQRIVEMDPKQMWVIINHIYQRKISSSHLFKYLHDNNQIAYRSLFQMSNSNDDQIIQAIMKHEQILQVLMENLKNYNIDIRKYSLRIVGNILAEKQDYVYVLNKYGVLGYLYEFLNQSHSELRKDACWALSNFAVQKVPSTVLLQSDKLIEKLLIMLETQRDNKIKVELCHIFACLVAFAQKTEAFQLIWKGHLLERCGDFLQIQDPDLIHVSLYLMTKIIDLGDYFADEDGNCFINQIKSLGLKSKITEKTYYTENNQISKLSSQLQEKLQEDY